MNRHECSRSESSRAQSLLWQVVLQNGCVFRRAPSSAARDSGSEVDATSHDYELPAG